MSSDPDVILDTSTLLLLARLTEVAQLPARPTITTITLAELTVGPLLAKTDLERAARLAHVEQAESDFRPLPFDAASARAFGRVAANLRAANRKPAARAYDALIAATAIANGLPLYTVNPSDFVDIDDLVVHTVQHPVGPA